MKSLNLEFLENSGELQEASLKKAKTLSVKLY